MPAFRVHRPRSYSTKLCSSNQALTATKSSNPCPPRPTIDTLFPVFVNQPSRPRGDPTPSPTIPPTPVRHPPQTQSGLSPQHQEKESPDPAPPGSPTQA